MYNRKKRSISQNMIEEFKFRFNTKTLIFFYHGNKTARPLSKREKSLLLPSRDKVEEGTFSPLQHISTKKKEKNNKHDWPLLVS